MEKYGHYIQSQRMGFFYFPIVAIPSLASAAFTSDLSGGMKHSQRWFEVDASYLGAKYFDKKYGRGKEGYTPNSPDYFDIKAFKSYPKKGGIDTRYINPRLGVDKQDCGFPYSSKVVFWDFIF